MKNIKEKVLTLAIQLRITKIAPNEERKNMRHLTKPMLLILLIAAQTPAYPQEFTTAGDIVEKIKHRFKDMKSYQAEFKIVTVKTLAESKRKKSTTSRGSVYYKKGGLVNFSFTQPRRDVIISNGKKMWIYLHRLNAVGIQTLETKGNLYNANTYEGLVSLFSRYHYYLQSHEQPVTIKGKPYYVLALKERVASGGFTEILLRVDAKSYLISSMEAISPQGTKVSLSFSRIVLDKELPNSLFQFKVEGSTRVIEEPMTNLN